MNDVNSNNARVTGGHVRDSTSGSKRQEGLLGGGVSAQIQHKFNQSLNKNHELVALIKEP